MFRVRAPACAVARSSRANGPATGSASIVSPPTPGRAADHRHWRCEWRASRIIVSNAKSETARRPSRRKKNKRPATRARPRRRAPILLNPNLHRPRRHRRLRTRRGALVARAVRVSRLARAVRVRASRAFPSRAVCAVFSEQQISPRNGYGPASAPMLESRSGDALARFRQARGRGPVSPPAAALGELTPLARDARATLACHRQI